MKRSDSSFPLMETIRDVLCYGDVLFHVESQQIDLTLETRCDIFNEEMQIIDGQVVEDDRNYPRVAKIRVAILMSGSAVGS